MARAGRTRCILFDDERVFSMMMIIRVELGGLAAEIASLTSNM